MKIAVGTKNPAKIAGVSEAFKAVWPEKNWEIFGVGVSSGISDQPMSDEESILGAKNRAKQAMEKSGADFAVGLEGGLQKIDGRYFDSGWAVVIDKSGRQGIGSSLRVILPPKLEELVLKGMEVGLANDKVFNKTNSKQADGHFGLMTNGLIPRSEGYKHGIISALTRFMKPELFNLKITVCGSIAFFEDMVKAKADLENLGHEVMIPPVNIKSEAGEPISVTEYYNLRKAESKDVSWIWERKAEAMKAHFDKVAWGDAVLVINKNKNNIEGYIGANSLLEMGLAFHLSKKIFLLNPIPEISYKEEILGMSPIIINGDYNLIG